MKRLEDSTVDAFVEAYLVRESTKHGGQPSESMPPTPAERLLVMWAEHHGKMVEWFLRARWYVGLIDSLDELEHLLILENRWTRDEGLVTPNEPRLLRNAVSKAIATSYFHLPKDGREWHHYYYRQFETGARRLQGPDRVVLRTLVEGERRQLLPFGVRDVTFYLHDGIGRLLPYATLIREGRLVFAPVEALVAEER